jgi:cytochrome c-type biogenesis protein
MVDSPSILLALAAGFVSFVSPCCLPLVPGYLAAISAGTVPGPGERPRPAAIVRSLIFIASFAIVFILLGLSATALGSALAGNQLTLRRVAGVAIALMGLIFIGSAFVGRLNREWRPPGLLERAGNGGPVVAGVAFALAWTPCVGPTLGAILGLASTQRDALEGGLLLAVYSAGLGVPFLLAAVGFQAAQRSFAWIRRHYVVIQVGAGAVLVAMGALVFTNQLFRINIEVQKTLDQWGLNFFQSI